MDERQIRKLEHTLQKAKRANTKNIAPEERRKAAVQDQRDNQNLERQSSWRMKLPRIKSEVLMVWFTGGLFFASTLQWFATRQTISSSESTFKSGNRAYIGATSAVILKTGPIDAAGRVTAVTVEPGKLKLSTYPVVVVELTNTGLTPARDARGWAHMDVPATLISNDEPSQPPADTQDESKWSRKDLAKDVSISLTGSLGHPLSEDQISQIMAGRLYLTIYGELRYSDIFNVQRTSTFCYFYQRGTDEMDACPGHNRIN